MLETLLHLLAPGEKLPPGASQFSVSYEGLSWGWAFFCLVALVAAVAWSYRYFAPRLSLFTRIGLVSLRSILIALLLLLLIRPMLLITIEESVRRPLLVLLDTTQSMGLVDPRTQADDLARAAIAQGLLNPSGGLKQSLAGLPVDSLKKLSRRQILEAVAANPQLKFWPRLYARADLSFYGFGRSLRPLGDLTPEQGHELNVDDAATFFRAMHYDDDLTAIGDGLRDLLEQQRGQPVAGVLLITDGANNSGSSPIEAAAIAKSDGVPLFVYGTGITTPPDIRVAELSGPQISSVKEKVEMTVRLSSQGMIGKKATLQLKANGKVVDEEPLEFRADGDQEATLSFTPDAVGDVDLVAYVPPLPEEANQQNNSASTRIHISDDKIKVLYVEGEPRWDYQYLLAMLQRDRRIKPKCVLLNGDEGLDTGPDSTFLNALPEDKETLESFDLVIIGDVDPTLLGNARMQILNDWVSKQGGSILFLAGPKFDPAAYLGTPLEDLLPVQPEAKTADRYQAPVQLKLTPAGESSPLLILSDDPQENKTLWDSFPGVHWTASVTQPRPGAQVLLVDPTPSRSTADGPMPVMALESYGAGQSFYIGFDETYRWRSHVGEKYYTRIWGQIIQALSGQHSPSTQATTQLKSDRVSYLTGDRIHISGRLFKAPGVLSFQAPTPPGGAAPAPQITNLALQAVSGQAGDYRGELIAQNAGSYTYSTVNDPSVVLKFQVTEPQVELSDIAMNEKLLRAMAAAGGGTFLREEDLFKLPDLLSSKSNNSVTLKKIPLGFTPYLLALMILVACLEWFWRRRLELK
jgi:uncharacterized membrane protein